MNQLTTDNSLWYSWWANK